MELDACIPDNDPVRLISQFVEEMDLAALYDTYERMPSEKYASPEIMLKVMLYAYHERKDFWKEEGRLTMQPSHVLERSISLNVQSSFFHRWHKCFWNWTRLPKRKFSLTEQRLKPLPIDTLSYGRKP